MAVNGISLLNLLYEEALKLLQSTDHTVELTVSQIFSNKFHNRQCDNNLNKQASGDQMLQTDIPDKQNGHYIEPENLNVERRTTKGVSRGERSRKARSVTQINDISTNICNNFPSSDHLSQYQNHERSHSHDEEYSVVNKSHIEKSKQRSYEDNYLLSARSMPDLPKVSTLT